MPRGPKGEKRPADVIGNAVRVMRIGTGEEEEDAPSPKSSAAALGALGGAARAKKLWSMEDLAGMIEAAQPAPAPRGPYKKQEAA
jgi:hypothetical protein